MTFEESVTTEDREIEMIRILQFAREKGKSAPEINALIMGSAWILGCDLVANSVRSLAEVVKIDLVEALTEDEDKVWSPNPED